MQVNVGFIGTGNIATTHFNSLEQIPEARVAAVYDVVPERAEAAAKRFGARVYPSYRRLIEEAAITALYVCVPPFAHEDQEVLAARRGLHMLVEKPVALSVEKAREVTAAIADAGVMATAGYHWRYSPLTDRARELLSGRTIGLLLGQWHGGLPGVAWWRNKAQSGGQMVEQATHIVDLARYLVGAEIVAVQAFFAVRALGNAPGFDAWDVGTANVRFANGVVGNISTSCMNGRSYTVGLHVLTDGLAIEQYASTLRVIEQGHTQEYSLSEPAYQIEDRAFIKAVSENDPTLLRSTYADAAQTLAVTLAMNASAERDGELIPVEA